MGEGLGGGGSVGGGRTKLDGIFVTVSHTSCGTPYS